VQRSVSPKKEPIPALTGLRFLAALAVFFFHYGATFATSAGVPGPISVMLRNGYLGVSLFFVLSGFILTYVHHDDEIDRRFLARFYFARFARIYPVYFLALCVAFPLAKSTLTFPEMARVLTMIQSWTAPSSADGFLWIMQAWTLSVELFFYLCFPVALIFIRRINKPSTVALAGILAVLMVATGSPSIMPTSPFLPFDGADTIPLPAFRLIEFLYGMTLCRLLHLLNPISSNGGGLRSITLALLIAIILSSSGAPRVVAASTVLMGPLVVDLAGNSGVLARFLSSRTMLLLGGASYALYLFQGPIRSWCEVALPHPIDRFASPVLTVVIAIVVFRLWEQPVRKLLNAWYERTTQSTCSRLPS
jgi:peptidoglycan/LPS O-acetylase OafA/YrhL